MFSILKYGTNNTNRISRMVIILDFEFFVIFSMYKLRDFYVICYKSIVLNN